jgi:hypothetical protein
LLLQLALQLADPPHLLLQGVLQRRRRIERLGHGHENSDEGRARTQPWTHG